MSETWTNELTERTIDIEDTLGDLIPTGMEYLVDAYRALNDVHTVSDDRKSTLVEEAQEHLERLAGAGYATLDPELRRAAESLAKRLDEITN